MLRPYTSQQNERLYDFAEKTHLDHVYKAIKSTENKFLQSRLGRQPLELLVGLIEFVVG